jgi:hypothetical protein
MRRNSLRTSLLKWKTLMLSNRTIMHLITISLTRKEANQRMLKSTSKSLKRKSLGKRLKERLTVTLTAGVYSTRQVVGFWTGLIIMELRHQIIRMLPICRRSRGQLVIWKVWLSLIRSAMMMKRIIICRKLPNRKKIAMRAAISHLLRLPK